MERLFVYGLLRFPKLQKEAFGRAVSGTPATLHGFRKTIRTMPDGRYFVIVPSRTQSVRGVVLSVSKKELRSADKVELGYHRIKVHAGGESEWAYAPKHEQHKKKARR